MTNFVYCQRHFAVFSIFFSLQSAAVYSLRSWVFWPVSSSTSCLQLAPIAAQQRKPIKWRFVRVANCICLPIQLMFRPFDCLSAPLLIPLCLSVCLVKLRLHILLAYRLSKVILIKIHFESNFLKRKSCVIGNMLCTHTLHTHSHPREVIVISSINHRRVSVLFPCVRHIFPDRDSLGGPGQSSAWPSLAKIHNI